MKYETRALEGPLFRAAVLDPGGRPIAYAERLEDAIDVAEALTARLECALEEAR